MLAIKSSLTSLAVDWFGMTTTVAASVNSADGDLIITLRSELEKPRESSHTRPIIVFQDIVSNDTQESTGIFPLSQPYVHFP